MTVEGKMEMWALENPTKTALTDEALYRELYKALSYPQKCKCLYCKENPCSHWDGLAFKNPEYYK